jgi:drug/metabolite transporter (DMT)-like permease
VEQWFVYTIIALGAFGIQRFLYKVSAEKKCNTAWTTFSFMGTVAVMSSVFYLVFGKPVENMRFLFFISLINSGSFLMGTITTIEALKYLSTSVAYPAIRLNTAIVVIFSILYFKDNLSAYQGTGIILAIAVIVMLTGSRGDGRNTIVNSRFHRGIMLTSAAFISGAVAAISSKFAAIGTDHLAFIALSYGLSMVFAFLLRSRLQGREENPDHRNALVIGFCMGLVNFGGFYALLRALSTGPLSLVIPITGMYFVIAVVLSSIIYRERLTSLRLAGIVLTAVSITLMRM